MLVLVVFPNAEDPDIEEDKTAAVVSAVAAALSKGHYDGPGDSPMSSCGGPRYQLLLMGCPSQRLDGTQWVKKLPINVPATL